MIIPKNKLFPATFAAFFKSNYQEVSIMGDNFNDNLKEARLRSGLSQKEVAENIGVAKSTYSLYESGNREPNVNTIKKIADCLNVSADTLLGLNDELTTLAAHFDGKEYTEDELNEIRQFAEFVKNKRK